MSQNTSGQPGTRRLRLIICGICYRESCPLSRWVEEGDDGGVSILDEITDLFFQCLHEEFEEANGETRQITEAEKAERLAEIEQKFGSDVQLDVVIDGEIQKREETTETVIKTQDDGFLAGILAKASEPVEVQQSRERLREHGNSGVVGRFD